MRHRRAEDEMTNDWLIELQQKGWTAMRRGSPSPRLAEILATLGATKIASRANRATSAQCARPNTLSSRYGLGEFPLHTDGAEMDHPPRYVLLASTLPRVAATLVLSLKHPSGPLLNHGSALFRVVGRRQCHFARFSENRPSGAMVRYNAATHRPMNDAAANIEADIAVSSPLAERIDWTRMRAVIVDNWICLHGREQVEQSDRGKMHRLQVWTRP